MQIFISTTLIIISLFICQPIFAQNTEAKAFFTALTGEWVGKCEEQVDKAQPVTKYFHVIVKHSGNGVFDSKFKYYEWDSKKKKLTDAGNMSFITTIDNNGHVENKVTGKGTLVFDKKTKKQEYSLTEVLSIQQGKIQGAGSGKIKVHNMPFGLGSNGKLNKTQTIWSLSGDALNMEQNLKVAFKALCFTKTFQFKAKYSAHKGSDVQKIIDK